MDRRHPPIAGAGKEAQKMEYEKDMYNIQELANFNPLEWLPGKSDKEDRD